MQRHVCRHVRLQACTGKHKCNDEWAKINVLEQFYGLSATHITGKTFHRLIHTKENVDSQTQNHMCTKGFDYTVLLKLITLCKHIVMLNFTV